MLDSCTLKVKLNLRSELKWFRRNVDAHIVERPAK